MYLRKIGNAGVVTLTGQKSARRRPTGNSEACVAEESRDVDHYPSLLIGYDELMNDLYSKQANRPWYASRMGKKDIISKEAIKRIAGPILSPGSRIPDQGTITCCISRSRTTIIRGPWYGPLMYRLIFPALRKRMRDFMNINATTLSVIDSPVPT